MSKRKDKIKIRFLGQNSYGVTGSLTLVEYKNKSILLECGLFQEGTVLENYYINKDAFKGFNPKDIDYCFVEHCHIDHSGLLPRLVKNGFKGKIITTHISANILKPLLTDSAYIHKKDADYLYRKKSMDIEPLYTEEDVQNTFNYIYEYGYNEVFQLDDVVSFKFLHNCHLIGASQLELFIKKDSGLIEKILYTSDLGNSILHKPFVYETEYCTKASVAIFESTYGLKERSISKKDREKDIEKIKSIITETVLVNKSCVLIPSFSLDRSQFIMKILYDLFKDTDLQVVVDSPLTKKITDCYLEVLQGENKKTIEEVVNWKNIRFITDKDDSRACITDGKPKVVVSASGFLDKGRSINYLKQFLPNEKAVVLFVGYMPQNSLAYKIKNGKGQKTISIEGKPYKNKANIYALKSFSSHLQHEQLVDYIKGMNVAKVYLVHGDIGAKKELKSALEEELSKIGKTTKIICTNKQTTCNL